MGISVNWMDADKKIIRYEFSNNWKWDELYSAMTQVNEMMASVPYNVYVMISLEHSNGVPPGALTQMRIGTLKAAPNWGGGVFIGVNSFLTALLNTFTMLNKKLGERYAIAKTDEEAMIIINKWREKETPLST
ncbi:MAG: hypothetical protein GC179_19870 [Anaerolineaceae bacterium]|nr:hypothetical protein [Anaerolineaceae bacterium]